MSQTDAADHRTGPKLDAAAGGIVARIEGTTLQIVLICMKRPGAPKWSLPKGHFKKKETPEQAALREVREETGLEVEILHALGTIDYWFSEKGTLYHKFVHYFAMRTTGGSFADHDDEVTAVEWFPFDHALTVMAFENERDIVASSRQQIHRALLAATE